MKKELEKKSKYLAKLLRHEPEDLILDKSGWVKSSEVCTKLDISQTDLELIVATNDKKRFEFDTSKTKIRASQGHSLNHLEVWKDWESYIPMNDLYHGTADKSVNSILRTGLKSISRTHVHLTENEETALKVGSRHGEVVLLLIDAVQMYNNGINFYKSANGVILVDFVAPEYISLW
jgi:putative RNA 2'-phosphotransferase